MSGRSPDLHLTAAARLAGDGQRYTTHRRSLVDVLDGAEGPVTIPEILAALPDLPQSSAYRNLAVLEGAGVVHRIVTSGDFTRYELAEELTDDHHHHLVCSECGSVSDFSVSPRLERSLDVALREATAAAGFEPQRHQFDVIGRCSECR